MLKDLGGEELPQGVDPVTGHTPPKKGNLKFCENYRTIGLISHPSKVMIRIIFNRLKSKTEELLVEEYAVFRAGRSTLSDEQIFNCGIIIKKHLT